MVLLKEVVEVTQDWSILKVRPWFLDYPGCLMS